MTKKRFGMTKINNLPIGILDSGVGGLSIWKEIVELLPNESTIYIADSKNCPYGNKSLNEVYQLSRKLIQFLLEKKVKLIVIACNTITVSCLDKLREEFREIPIIGTVPVVKIAAQKTKNKKIGIFSTTATAKSTYQKNLIQKFAKDCEVINVGTDKLVPLIEKDFFNYSSSEAERSREVQRRNSSRQARTIKILTRVLRPFIDAHIDTLVMGCTHFPFIKKQIQKIIGKDVFLLDSGRAIARQVKRVIDGNRIAGEAKALHLVYTTSDHRIIEKAAKKLIEDRKLIVRGI